MFPSGLAYAWRDPRKLHPLIGVEAEQIERANAKRKAEFSAGRAAARAALGMPEQVIEVGKSRAPIWPTGYCGSISHSKTRCVAIVGSSQTYLGIGVDIELDTPLNDDLRESILCDCERSASGSEAIQIFSMKEAFYKALSPHLDRILTFHDVHIEQQDDHHVAVLRNAAGMFAAGFRAKVTCQPMQDHVLSFCVVQQGERR